MACTKSSSRKASVHRAARRASQPHAEPAIVHPTHFQYNMGYRVRRGEFVGTGYLHRTLMSASREAWLVMSADLPAHLRAFGDDDSRRRNLLVYLDECEELP